MKKYFLKAALFGILIFSIVGCAAQKPNWKEIVGNKGMVFTYHFKKGEKHTYRFITNSSTSQEMAGQTQETNLTNRSVLHYEVKDVLKNGTFVIQSTVDSTAISSSNPMINQVNSLLQKSLHKPVELIVTKTGEIDTVKGLNAFPTLQGSADWKRLFESLFFKLPAKPIKIGDSWTETKTTHKKSGPMDMTITSKTKYLLKSIKPYKGMDCLFITYTTDLTLSGEGSQAGMGLNYSGSGSGSGKIYFDPVSSTFLSMSSESNIDGNVTIPSRNMEIPSSTMVSVKAVRIK
ncbi:MAG: hypothetical protein GXO76_14635 [Calditrichaeota bacterium]|nr:hypothetical protein [Calditrichota bacterium]